MIAQNENSNIEQFVAAVKAQLVEHMLDNHMFSEKWCVDYNFSQFLQRVDDSQKRNKEAKEKTELKRKRRFCQDTIEKNIRSESYLELCL